MAYQRKKHFIETDITYALLYSNLLKNENYWRNNGQYFLAKEYELRAKSLLAEDIEGANKPVKTEGNYCPTKKISF